MLHDRGHAYWRLDKNQVCQCWWRSKDGSVEKEPNIRSLESSNRGIVEPCLERFVAADGRLHSPICLRFSWFELTSPIQKMKAHLKPSWIQAD